MTLTKRERETAREEDGEQAVEEVISPLADNRKYT